MHKHAVRVLGVLDVVGLHCPLNFHVLLVRLVLGFDFRSLFFNVYVQYLVGNRKVLVDWLRQRVLSLALDWAVCLRHDC